MQEDFRNTEIDGVKFFTKIYMAKKAFILQNKIVKYVSPSIGHIIEATGKMPEGASSVEDILDSDIEGEAVSKIFKDFFESLPPEKMYEFAIEIFEFTSFEKEGEEKTKTVPLKTEEGFNSAFRGNMFRVYKVLWWVLKENYNDIAEMLGGNFLDLKGGGDPT